MSSAPIDSPGELSVSDGSKTAAFITRWKHSGGSERSNYTKRAAGGRPCFNLGSDLLESIKVKEMGPEGMRIEASTITALIT